MSGQEGDHPINVLALSYAEAFDEAIATRLNAENNYDRERYERDCKKMTERIQDAIKKRTTVYAPYDLHPRVIAELRQTYYIRDSVLEPIGEANKWPRFWSWFFNCCGCCSCCYC